jgi:hypothetical protein
MLFAASVRSTCGCAATPTENSTRREATTASANEARFMAATLNLAALSGAEALKLDLPRWALSCCDVLALRVPQTGQNGHDVVQRLMGWTPTRLHCVSVAVGTVFWESKLFIRWVRHRHFAGRARPTHRDDVVQPKHQPFVACHFGSILRLSE